MLDAANLVVLKLVAYLLPPHASLLAPQFHASLSASPVQLMVS